MMITKPDWDNIPEITIKLYKFKLFEKEVFMVLMDNQIVDFKEFVEKLNKYLNFQECKKELIISLLEKRGYNTNVPNNIKITDDFLNSHLVASYLGTHFMEAINKIEDEYQTTLREHKINQITDDKSE